ncbi:MAG TPA: hypothetical protein VMW44_01210 [Candidatus Bathyarchaeia archaeon]|nr:hypothetical protein [Candidatus Bathyarchaeia archaeon]
MCDHTIGFLQEFVNQSKIKKVIENECYSWNRHGKTMAELTGDTKEYKSDIKPVDFLDRRRGYMTIFNYCPYCGEKINWKDIKGGF